MGLAPRMILLTLSLDNFAILKGTICLASLSEDHSPSKNASPSRQKEEEEKEKKRKPHQSFSAVQPVMGDPVGPGQKADNLTVISH